MNLFAGAWEARDVSPLPVDIPLATDNQVSHSQALHFKIYALQLNQTFAISFWPVYKLDSELHRAGEPSQETCCPAGKPSDTPSNASR